MHMKMPNKVWIKISNGPELIGGIVLQTCLSHSHTGMVNAKKRYQLSTFENFSFQDCFQDCFPVRVCGENGFTEP